MDVRRHDCLSPGCVADLERLNEFTVLLLRLFELQPVIAPQRQGNDRNFDQARQARSSAMP
jgi:hypothetical protein